MDKQQNGTMGSDPATGECYAAYKGQVPPDELAELMERGTLFERKSLSEIVDAFCEVHPSRRVTQLGPVVGHYLGRDIHDWYETADGRRHNYVGVCGPRPDFDTLESGQSVLAPGLLYQPHQPAS